MCVLSSYSFTMGNKNMRERFDGQNNTISFDSGRQGMKKKRKNRSRGTRIELGPTKNNKQASTKILPN